MIPSTSMTSPFSLQGRTILVTGAGGDIGRGIMRAIESVGGQAIGWDRAKGEGIDVVDVTDRSAVSRTLSTLEDRSPVWGLVTAAGIMGRPVPTFFDVDEDNWRQVIDVNLWGTFNVLQLWGKLRREAGQGGAAVTIASTNARVGTAHNPHYVASKGGVDALTRSAAVALAPFGVRVNAIGPGPVPTGLNTHRWTNQEGRATLLRGVVLGRLGSPQDIGNAAVYLLSDASAWTTGASLYVDGGLTMARCT